MSVSLILVSLPLSVAAQEMRVLLQRLDKVTARTFPIEVGIEDIIHFGTLELIIHKCETSNPEDPIENAAFLEISELREQSTPRLLFMGWMFSSSPAISALEHPVYDVWVVSCKKVSS